MEVTFEGIEKRYGDFYAVRDLNLKVKDGALHFFLGPSGCGKTTTLRMLAGLEKPTAGRILFDNKDVTSLPAAERGIGMVFQNYALWPHMTVKKNIEYGLKLKKLESDEVKRRLQEVIEITQLQGFEERLPGQLSGGQQQRVALARALAVRPNVLLLDEPLSNLDAKLRLEMRDNISRIHRQTGITTIYVTHDQKEALSMGSEVSVMRKGILVQTDSPRKLYFHPKSAFIAGFIGETNLFEGKVIKRTENTFVVETMFGPIQALSKNNQFQDQEKVLVSLRPEAIQVLFKETSVNNVNVIDLKLSHLTYLGESEQYQLGKDGCQQLLKATVFHAPEQGLKEGDNVKISIAPEDVLVLPYDDVTGGT